MRRDERMSDLIRVRVFSAEKRALAEAARERGVSRSEMVRDAAAEAARPPAA